VRSYLYLSPHFDDAVYSAGGLIHRQARAGERVVVLTVCAGSPSGPFSEFAQTLHARWQLAADAAVLARRAEDIAALRLLGAEAVHLDVPDCIYRAHPETGEPLYASEAALFGEVDPAEGPLVQKIAAAIRAALPPGPEARVYAPLGLGHHVDHQLTRRAAEALGRSLLYTEDYPYAQREPETVDWEGATAGLAPRWVPFDEADFDAHCRAAAAYRSQLGSFWPDEAEMRLALRRFVERAGEGQLELRLWSKDAQNRQK
jgi:LmbE family N-acetylglucosaminyl deacetylase